ncbi:MAG: Ig-like domain-containing protein, partial [Candidatus Zixiibacteriota bacterium]
MSGKRTSAVEFLIIFSFLFLLLNCAELAPPPGGEEDRTSPTLIRTLPENKSIHVTSGREITFWFSEGISKPSISKPVFISPRQEQNPELKWKSDRLIVKLAEPFDSNQTYVVTLTSEISDWRRNKMDSTVSIAFSTGDRIDSGSISGFVLAYGKPKSGVLVGLFEQSSPA